MVSGYFIFFNNPTYNYQKYNTRKNELLTASVYSDYSAYFQVNATSTVLINGKYSVVVTIDQVSQRLEEVEVLVISGNEKITSTDANYPSKNILYSDIFHLAPMSDTTSETEKHGINFNFISADPVSNVYLFVGFKRNSLPTTLYIQKAITG
jgi:hypothetical protein